MLKISQLPEQAELQAAGEETLRPCWVARSATVPGGAKEHFIARTQAERFGGQLWRHLQMCRGGRKVRCGAAHTTCGCLCKERGKAHLCLCAQKSSGG